MALLPIRIYPDPVLRVKSAPVERFDEGLERLAADMIETMHAAPGVGLAAPQVGEQLRLTVIDVSGGAEAGGVHVLVNPELISRTGSVIETEGCLSIPDLTEKVERPEEVTVAALDLSGRRFELHGSGLLARALCHEIDHLDGILFVDHLRGLRRERAKRHLRRLAKQSQAVA